MILVLFISQASLRKMRLQKALHCENWRKKLGTREKSLNVLQVCAFFFIFPPKANSVFDGYSKCLKCSKPREKSVQKGLHRLAE